MKVKDITENTTARVTSVRPNQSAEIDNGDGTKTVIDLKKNPGALQRDSGTGKLRLNTNNRRNNQGQNNNQPRPGDQVEIDDED